MDCAEVSPAAWPSLRPGIAGTVLVADDDLPPATDELEATGVEGGECSAAAVAAWHRLADTDEAAPLRSAIGLRPGARVVILATEGRTSQRR
jgi:diaminopropionate ammonia-lyase